MSPDMAGRHCPAWQGARIARDSLLSLRDAIGLDLRQRPRVSEMFPAERLERLIRQGKAAEAEAPLKILLEENPVSAPAIEGLIRVYSHTGRIRQAEALFDYAEGRGLAAEGVFLAMAEGYLCNGKAESAALIIDMAAGRGAVSASLFERLLERLDGQGCGPAVRAAFDKAHALGLADAKMFEAAFCIMVRKRDYAGASGLFRAHRKDFGNPAAYAAIIEAFASAGELSRVSWYFEEALARGAADGQIAASVIRTFDAADFPALARGAYFKALKAGACGQEAHQAMLAAYIGRGQARNALEILRCAGKRGGATVENHWDLFSLLEGRGEHDRACRLLVSSCRAGYLGADGVETMLSRLYGDSKYGRIVSVYEALPGAIRGQPRVALKAADALRKLGRYEESMGLLDHLLSRPGVGEDEMFRARAIIGFCLKDTGRKEEALRLFLELYRAVPAHCQSSERIMCGLIFSWDETRYDRRVTDHDVRSIHRRLLAAIPFARNSLREDMQDALDAIRKSSVLSNTRCYSAAR